MENRRFSIVGAGPGQMAFLTEQAREVIESADLVIATGRIAGSLAALRAQIKVCPEGQMLAEVLKTKLEHVAILVSGDTGFYSMSKQFHDRLLEHGAVEVIAGIGSLQYFSARLGTGYEDAYIVSLTEQQHEILGPVSYHHKVFVLTDGTHTVQKICETLCHSGLGKVWVSVGENLGSGKEHIEGAQAADLVSKSFDPLSVLMIENDTPAFCHGPLFDRQLIRGDMPMTKQEVRWISVGMLDLQPNDIVYDIDAGMGSVSFEIARQVRNGRVYAVEHRAHALELLERNREALGSFNVQIVDGVAPSAMDKLPSPSAAFIGSDHNHIFETLSALKENNPHIRVVINAVTIETLSDAQIALSALKFKNVEICEVSVARGRATGGNTLLQANNPVFILAGGGKSI